MAFDLTSFLDIPAKVTAVSPPAPPASPLASPLEAAKSAASNPEPAPLPAPVAVPVKLHVWGAPGSHTSGITAPEFAPIPIQPSSASRSSRGRGSRKSIVIVSDDRAVMSLIDECISKAGISQRELADRLGLKHQSVNQYRMLRRKRPSIQWISKLVTACGARLVVEWPESLV